MRPEWQRQLRLLPAGGENLSSALLASALTFGAGVLLALPAAIVFLHELPGLFQFTVSLASGLTLLSLATAGRILGTRPIERWELGVQPQSGQVFLGPELPRVPTGAVILPLQPRRFRAQGREFEVSIPSERARLLELAAELKRRGEDLEAHVQRAFGEDADGSARLRAEGFSVEELS